MTPAVGEKAPEFCLYDKDGTKTCLNDIQSKYTVIYFYPKDNTPGCTIEANGFQSLKNEFEQEDATILGISGGDEKSKRSFCEKNDLDITLLSDKDFSIATKYGVYGEKKMLGKTSKAITRSSFLLDKDKNIIKIYPNVNPQTHPKQVLTTIQRTK